MSSSNSSRVCASSADSGSSMRNTAGRTASARAMPTRCRMPPESCFGSAEAKSLKSRALERVGDAPLHLGRTELVVLQHERDVVAHAEPRQQREILEDEGDLVQRVGRRHAAQHDLAGRRLQDAARDAEQRRFAAARRADDRDDLAFVRVQRDVLERREIAESVRDVR